MTKNPVINALAGLLYIAAVASFLFYGPTRIHLEESVFLPIMMLSLFVFSAACTSYIFLYQPLQLFLEGEKKKSVNLFIKTFGVFAVSATTLVVIGLYLSTHL